MESDQLVWIKYLLGVEQYMVRPLTIDQIRCLQFGNLPYVCKILTCYVFFYESVLIIFIVSQNIT